MAKTLEDVTLADLLPPSIASDVNVEHSAAAIDPELQQLAVGSKLLPILSRIDELPGAWLDRLAWQWHADAYDSGLPIEQKRKIVKRVLRIHRYKGTVYAVKQALESIDFESEVIEDTGAHHIFDLKVSLSDGADIETINRQIITTIDSAKPVSRHLRKILHNLDVVTYVFAAAVCDVGALIEVFPASALSTDVPDAVIRGGSAITLDLLVEVYPSEFD